MSTSASSLTRAALLAALIGSFALAHPVYAASSSMSEDMDMSDSAKPMHSSAKKAAMSPGDMQEKVEQRIKTLHDKLNITADQESAWNGVAQAMRDNESNLSSLIQARHQNAKTMTAVDDLESYQKIAQAHADGLKNVAAAFEPVYDDMSDDQKKNADEVFGRFEGHRDEAAKASKMSGK